jgi:hypothetical protein
VSQFRLSVSLLNTIVKNREEIERNYVHCGPFSKQLKSLNCSPLEKLGSALAAWFKQACEANASVDGWHPPQGEGLAFLPCLANFSASNRWTDLIGYTILFTELYQLQTIARN